MRKIISLFIFIIIACSINGLDNAFKSELPIKEEVTNKNVIIDNVQDDKKLEKKSELIQEPIQKEIVSSKDTEEKNEIILEESTIKNEVSTTKEDYVVEEQPKKNENVITSPSNEIKQEQKEVQESKSVVPEKNNPWDSLGITEYEYYHTPAHSWAKLDFKISDYGNRDATFNACNNYGNEHKSEYGGGFECLPVNSYSGNYIGEMIEFY